MQSPRMAPAAAAAVPPAHPMEGASPEPKRPKARGDATATAMQQNLTVPEVIAGLGDLHGRVNRDEEYFANIHDYKRASLQLTGVLKIIIYGPTNGPMNGPII